MELKFVSWYVHAYDEFSSNRTFMELKFGKRYSLAAGGIVLIVPLWN